DQASGLALRFLANLLHSRFANDSYSRTAGLEGGYLRGSVHESKRWISVTHRTDFEAERVLVGEPSGEFGFELAAEVGAYVEVGDAGSAAQPFQNAAAGEIHVEGLDVYGDSAQGLERIEHYVGADLVGLFDDGRCIVDIRAAEDDMRDGDDQGLLVDRVEQAVGGNDDAVFALHHVYAGAVLALRFPEIHHRGEVQVGVDDFVALAGEVEAGGDDRLAGSDVLVS